MSITGNVHKVLQAYQVISIGTKVATFLLNTNRVVVWEAQTYFHRKYVCASQVNRVARKAIQLAEECLIVLNNTVQRDNTEIFNLLYLSISFIFFQAYPYIHDYTRASEWGEKILEVTVQVFGEFSDQLGSLAMRLAHLYRRQLKFEKAKELFERALPIKQETGNRHDEAMCYGHLGLLFHHLGQYHNVKKYVEKALEIRKEIGDKQGMGLCYGNLGIIFESLGQYDKAIEYIFKSLLIRKEIGDREGEATDYINAANVLYSVGEYAVGKNCAQKALEIQKEIGHREGEAACYSSFATFFRYHGQYAKAIQYLKKALLITKETESACYVTLGHVYIYLGEYAEAKENTEKALKISKEIGDVEKQFACHYHLGWIMMFEGNTEESISNLFSSIQNCEDLRSFLGDHDPHKVSLLDKHFPSYQTLSKVFCKKGDYVKALYVLELGRARALTELMSTQYFAGKQITIDPQSWMGIEGIIKKGSSFTCLYISYFVLDIYLWILNQKQSVHFRHINKSETVSTIGPVRYLNAFLRNPPFRGCQKLPQGHCEDRSMFPLVARSSSFQGQEDRVAALRLVELDEDDQEQEPTPTLGLL